MKTKPKLIRILNPPPLSASSNSINLGVSSDLASLTSKAQYISLCQHHPMTAGTITSPISFKLYATTIHSNQPLLAYVMIPEGDISGGSGETSSSSMIYHNIIVQQQHTRQIVWTMSIGELACSAMKSDSTMEPSKLHKIVKEQYGVLQKIQFLDPSTLYWNGFFYTGEANTSRCWSYLMIQFQFRTLIVNIRQHHVSLFPTNQNPNQHQSQNAFQSIISIIIPETVSTSSNNPAWISSNVLAISSSQLIVGCDDGTLKVYDWNNKKLVEVVHVPSTWIIGGTPFLKNDYIVEIISTNPYSYSPSSEERQRSIICITKKGVAFLCPLNITSTNSKNNNNSNNNKIIGIPIARMEGGSAPTSKAKADDYDHVHHNVGSSTGTDMSSSMEAIFIQYDAHRDLFLWMSPSKTKSKLLVWDLNMIWNNSNKNSTPAMSNTASNDKPDPTLVLQFPYENLSHMIFPGWFHESTPKESITCLVVTKEGDLQIVVGPLYNTGSTIKHPFMGVTILNVNLVQLVQRDLELPLEREPNFKVYGVYCPPVRDTSTLAVTTSIGILLIKMMDGNLVPFPGTRYAHFSANVGTMGRAVLFVKGPQIYYSPLEPYGGVMENNVIGPMEYTKKAMLVYESPPPLHLPPEIHKRPVRLPPKFLTSPSRNYICCFWKEEMRYEILSVAGMLERVTNRTSNLMTGTSPVVTSGNGVASFAWVGDSDVFCLLYDPEQDLALKVGINLSAPEASLGKELADLTKLKELKKLKEFARLKTYKKGMKSMVGTAGKLKSLEGLKDLGKDTGKFGLGTVKLTGKVVKLTGKVALGATQATTQAATAAMKEASASAVQQTAGATKKMTKMAVGTKKGVSKVSKLTFGWGKKKGDKKAAQGSLADAEIDEEEEAPARGGAPIVTFDEGSSEIEEKAASEQLEKKYPWVELRTIVSSGSGVDGAATATVSNLGQLTLRSGNRNPPTVLFGGPVLCVGSKLDESDEGLAYFYTKKKGQEEESTSVYVSSGPAFPCPDFVAWDDEGTLCAVVIQGRVSVYLSDEPNFVMLGTTRLGSTTDAELEIISCRFIHSVLYCTTRSSVQCIFLGDLEGGVCHLDSFILANSDVSKFPSKNIVMGYVSLAPPTIPMPLNHPEVLGYQNGSLMLSTVTGIIALPLGFPLLRIGTLISAGSEHYSKAEKWFDAVPNCDHEVLANFLERRGVPELALQLPGISLETIVDMCMRLGYIDRLEEVVETYGLTGLRAIDMSRGFSTNVFGPEDHGAGMVVCVGAYLISHGRIELVRRLATECLTSGEEGKQEAFLLASLLLSVSGSDSKRVIQRAVEDVDDDSDWLVGSFVRDHILAKSHST